ncbi:MAG: insulinase family protein [Candidatus Sungiibacteriota bacterium]|uniref:Insulinase family protein n=1 Tax=Candidatus Sungiibacteriota bacterium TaxID=2750080 RepID=A0A7T5RIW4_9BACT|nr:MAG: insulinase family protein [Candidatus Sungbacteria bacterium]
MFKKIILDNGLRVITAPMQGTNTVTVLVLCGTGSDYESREINGISHFLEHMFFKGTKNRPSPDVIKHELDSMGSISNAFTSHEITGYHVKAGKTYLDQSLHLLSDIYKNSTLPKEEIERERQVVIEEMHKDRDTPTLYVNWVWEHLLYGDQPAGWDVIGEEKIIRALKREEFVNYFNHQYVSSNTAVVVAGNFDEAATARLVKELFSDIRHEPPFRSKPPLREAQTTPQVKIIYKETDQTHLMIGFRGYDALHDRRYVAEVLAAVLGGSWSARMWDRIRDKLGLAYTVWSSHESYSNRGYLVTYAGVDHGNVKKTVRAILEEYKKTCEKPIENGELKRVKDYIRGTTLIGLEASNAVASFVGVEEMVTGKPVTIEEVFAKIEAVTADDLCAVAGEIFRPESLNLAMIGPFKDTAELGKILGEFK